jgi:hypothetical protein
VVAALNTTLAAMAVMVVVVEALDMETLITSAMVVMV